MKKPYLDLWSYINSIAPEVYVGEEVNHQTWISLSDLSPETYVGVPNEFIKYFNDDSEIEARLGRGTRWFTRIRESSDIGRLNTAMRTNRYPRLYELRTEDWSFINTISSCKNGLSIMPTYFLRPACLPAERELLQEIAEEIKQIGRSAHAGYRCSVRWPDERKNGRIHAAPHQIPLVYDKATEQIIFSETLHKKAEKLMRAREKKLETTVRSNETLVTLNAEVMKVRDALKACPVKTYDQRRDFIMPMVPKDLARAVLKVDAYVAKEIVRDVSSSYAPQLIQYYIKKSSQKQLAQLFASQKWQRWWKRLVNRMSEYELLYQKIGNKLWKRNAIKHYNIRSSNFMEGHIQVLFPLMYAAKLPGWEIVKRVFVMAGLDKE